MSIANLRCDARSIIDAAIAAADPGASFQSHVALENGMLRILGAGGYFHYRDIEHLQSLYVVGCGKATRLMAQALESCLGDTITDGAITVPHGAESSWTGKAIRVYEGAHPVPDKMCCVGAQEALALCEKAGPRDLIIVLLSGGGSALWTAPVDGVSLDDMMLTHEVLIACGAAIDEINCVRKHLSAIKGGRAAVCASPAFVEVLAISDVIGDRRDVIASGPFTADPSTYADAAEIIERYRCTLPDSVTHHIRHGCTGAVEETVKPGHPCFNRVQYTVIGSNARACDAAVKAAQQKGYQVALLPHPIQGESRDAARSFCEQARACAYQRSGKIALIAGGETTVSCAGSTGMGGRNQEFATQAAQMISTYEMEMVVAAIGTDGIDGPTDAAGAVVDTHSVNRAHEMDFDPAESLRCHDTYPLCSATGDLVKTGPTGTNVMDIYCALCER